MKIQDKITAFSQLQKKIGMLTDDELQDLAARAKQKNGWFSYEGVKNALQGISFMLEKSKLEKWAGDYNLNTDSPKIVGIVMAGNIPLVGFHDLLSVLISEHFAAVKPSSDDEFLTRTVIEWITEIEPRFKKNIEIREKLTGIDAVIATGSDNTARYFEYYFKDIPNIIRKNRTSVAILNGEESDEEFKALGDDIFSYFGLGCRNVSKVFTPKGFDIRTAFPHFENYQDIANHNKYRNNYDYYKSIYLVNKTPHLDTGFLLINSTDELVSPISVLFHQEYDSIEKLKTILDDQKDKIQCIVGKDYIPFGKAQRPELWDYADDVDTLAFLTDLK
ncbi:Acyl-CoA reductase (LuxC) [Ekhidna lutea]|uniref:Acyl-CoA reductase (LuxC) n=1 Tax=Ekhidna lutea TaxID=447679 RepID=A0A239L625_EKHLU|nr:acyl-CoA reductase [Ekhidna lutea]SNT25785.1 Acyl-CoA reductase (LuxC) [Ekhidna lutea]